MCETSSGRRDRQQPPELPGSPGTYGGDLTAALDHLIAVGGAAQAAELAVAAKADAVLFAAEVGLELSGMRCGKDSTCACRLAFYLADPTRFKALLREGKGLQDAAARKDSAAQELPAMKHAVQGGSSMLTTADVEVAVGLRPGCSVRIHGLKSKWGQEVNGSVGFILSVASAGTTFSVELEETGAVHELRAECLELVKEKRPGEVAPKKRTAVMRDTGAIWRKTRQDNFDAWREKQLVALARTDRPIGRDLCTRTLCALTFCSRKYFHARFERLQLDQRQGSHRPHGSRVGLAEISETGIDFQCCEDGCLQSPALGGETVKHWLARYKHASGAMGRLACLRDLLVARPHLCNAAIFEWLGINRGTTSMVVRPCAPPCCDMALSLSILLAQRTCVEQEGEGWEPPAHGLSGTTPWNKTSDADQAIIHTHLETYLYYDPGGSIQQSPLVSLVRADCWRCNRRYR